MQTDDQNEDGKTQTSHIGRYQVLGEVGRGGMAVVYRAYDPRFKREVAVKVLPRQFTHDHTFRSRFEREAQTIATLEHPAIVPVYDFGEEDEQPYLVMRYMSGGSLADRLQTGRLNLQQAAEMIANIAGALEYAHARGVVHRDLKPGNILFDDQHNPYLADFGIAKLAEATTSITGSSIIGTPAYMSPEQAKGGQPVDGRTDIYALGVILYEMLTGKAPYEADTPVQVLMKHIMDPVPELNTNQYNLPPAINKILHYALAKEVDIRYQTPHHLMSDLLALTRGHPPTLPAAHRTKVISPPRSPMLRWPWFAAGLLLLLALVSGGLWLGGVLRAPASPPAPAGTAASLSAVLTPTATTQPPTFTAVPSPTPTPTPTAAPTRAQTPTIGPVETTPPTLRILLSSVNVRTGPGVAYPVSGFLLLDQQVTVLAKSRDGNWYLVELPDGKRGWLASSVAEPVTPLDGVTIALTIPARPANTPLPATAPPTAPPPPRTATEPPPPPPPPPTSTARPPTPTPEPTAYPYPYP